MKKSMKRYLSLFLSFVMILSLCPVTVLADQTTTDADSNVVVSYDFEKLTSDGLVTDISGNGYHGTIQTGASVEDGVAVMNNGSKTNADTAGILIPTESFTGLTDYTIQMDMKIAAETFQHNWVQIFTAGTGRDHRLEMTNQGYPDSVYCGVSAWGCTEDLPSQKRLQAEADKILPQDEWGRWTYTQSGDVGTFYIDGVKVASGEFHITLADMAVEGSKAAIGAIVSDTSVQSVTGNIDNFVIYNEAKSAAEILEEYEFDYNVVVSYDFEELTADGQVTDISGHGYHGTIQTGASVEGGVAVLNNGSKTNADTAGILIPTESFTGLTDYTIQMDMKIAAETFQYDWVQIFTAGTGSSHRLEMTNQGYENNTDCGVSVWGKTAEYSSQKRLQAAADKLLPQDEWGRWTYTQSGNVGTIYIDGVKVASGEFYITLADMAVTGSKAAIGAIVSNTNVQSVTGNIDNFVIYNEAKTAEEVFEEYELDYNVVVGYDFEELTADGQVTDISGHGYHGTIQTGASVEGGVAVLNNGSKTNANTAGILIPTESFTGLTDYTIQMDMKIAAETFQYDWVQIFTAGTGRDHRLEMTNQGYPGNEDCGVSAWGYTEAYPSQKRLQAAADKLLPQNEWGRWTYTQSGNVGTIYIDGVKVASGEFDITLADMAVAGSKAAIGAIVSNTNVQSVTGNIDNFVIYNEAKTAEEICRSFVEDYNYTAIKIEAETATLTSPATVKTSSTASGGSKVGNIDNANATVTFDLSVPKTGSYVVEVVADSLAEYDEPGHTYWVNGDTDNKQTVLYPNSTTWNVWNSYYIQVDLNEGSNTLTFSIKKSTYAELDYIVLYQDIDETKEKINIAFDLNYTVEGGYAEVSFEGTGGTGNICTFNGTEIILETQKIEEVATDGVYHINADIDYAQQMVMITLTMPNGTEVQRGHFGLLKRIISVDKISIDTSGSVENVEITYPEPAKNTAKIPTAETTAFDSEAYNLVTSIIGDARTTRGFAWTAETSHANMVIEYAKADADFETEKVQMKANYISRYSLLYYEADVVGLEPGTKYVYRIGDTADNIWSSTYSFTTEAEDVTDFSFVAITDTQRTEDFLYLRQTVGTAMQEREEVAFLVNAGDIVEKGAQESQWTNYFAKLKGYLEDVPHVPVAGNHEYDYTYTLEGEESTGGERFGLHFNNPDNGGVAALGGLTVDDVKTQVNKDVITNIKDTIYSFDYGNAHFAVLNSGAYQGGTTEDLREDPITIINAQKAWLKNDLNNSDKQWKIVIIHQGVYDSYTWCESPITDVIYECGVDLVISGHTHDYSRSYPMKGTSISYKTNQDMLVKGEGAVYQVIGNVTNNGKSNIASEVPAEVYTYSNSTISEPTYTIYDFSESELRVVTKQLDGYVVDSFTISDETVKSKYNASIDKAAAEYTLGDTSAVISPLTLAEKYGDISITWTTSDASVVDKDGSITRSTSSDGTATLTATFSRVGTSYTKKVAFEVTVLKIADTTELQTVVAAGEEKLTRPLSHLYYEEEAWANYVAAIREGELVLYNQEFVQQEVDAVLDKIAEAEKALTEKLYTLNVTGGVICGKDGEEDVTTATYTAMQDTTITAERINGNNVFSYWAYDAEGTQIASYGRTFTFFMIKDMNLYAIYKPEGEVEEVVSVTANAVYDAELDKVVVTIRRAAPLDCVIVEHGILVTKDGSVALTVDNVGDIVKGVRKTDENGLPVNGLATVKVNLAYGETCYACGYVIYIDADGNRVTKYSEIVNAGKQSEDANVEEGTSFGDETIWPT